MYIGKIDPRIERKYDLLGMAEQDRIAILKKIWREKMGTELDLEHPRTFTEKIQWYKLNYYDPEMTRCEDKVAFKSYVAEKLGEGYTAKLLRVWYSPGEISFSGLPDQFTVKSNCQDNGRYIVPIFHKDGFDFGNLKQEISDYWFEPRNLLINGFCRIFYDMKPAVLVEEYIGEGIQAPNECKIFCFHGEPKICYATAEHFGDDKLNISDYPYGYYTLDWRYLNVSCGNHRSYANAPKPEKFNEMIEISNILSKNFPFVRIDFFYTEKRFYLAEMTFYPGSGLTKYAPPEFDVYMGNLFPINN